MKGSQIVTIDEYISSFPEEVQIKLEQIRSTILKAAPLSEEVISYGMPAFKYHGILIYFAAYKNHIGFYPTGSGNKNFKNDISVFKTSKGTVQFPLDKKVPLGLISKITKFRVKENLEKFNLKKNK